MQIGVFYDNMKSGQWENAKDSELFPLVKSIGISHFELSWDSVKEKGEPFRQLLRENGLGLAVYLFVDQNGITQAGTTVEEELPKMQDWGITKLLMVYAHDLPEQEDKRKAEEKIVVLLQKLCIKAKEYGITVTVEDFGSMRIPCGSCEDMVRFGQKAPALRFTLDTGNFYCFGEEVLPSYEKLRKKVVHVHVKDHPTPTDRVECTPGTGCLPMKELFCRLKEDKYDGWFTIEMFGTPMTEQALRDAVTFIRNNY